MSPLRSADLSRESNGPGRTWGEAGTKTDGTMEWLPAGQSARFRAPRALASFLLASIAQQEMRHSKDVLAALPEERREDPPAEPVTAQKRRMPGARRGAAATPSSSGGRLSLTR